MTDHLDVALIVDASKYYHRKVMHGVAAFRREAENWRLYLEEDPQQKLPDLRKWQADGIIADFDDPKVARAVAGLEIPMVGIGSGYGGYDPKSGIPYFAPDHAAVAKLAADHLLERGFRKFAYCGLRPNIANGWSIERGRDFARAVKQAGYPCSFYVGRHLAARRWQALLHELGCWLKSLEKPVGLMAANDSRARHVLEACRNLGVSVPEDIGVIGVNNDELCELTIPPLTSVKQNPGRLGYDAAALLARLMSGRKSRQKKFVVPPMDVVARESTDILAIEDQDTAAALRFIRDHACDPIHVKDVLDEASLSRSALEPRFKKALGRTIHAEIQHVQIQRVKQLLATTDLPIKSIARQVGFQYVQYLTTVFRQQTGFTPLQYRKRSHV